MKNIYILSVQKFYVCFFIGHIRIWKTSYILIRLSSQRRFPSLVIIIVKNSIYSSINNRSKSIGKTSIKSLRNTIIISRKKRKSICNYSFSSKLRKRKSTCIFFNSQSLIVTFIKNTVKFVSTIRLKKSRSTTKRVNLCHYQMRFLKNHLPYPKMVQK